MHDFVAQHKELEVRLKEREESIFTCLLAHTKDNA
jgi:hypothetical protein